MDLHKNIAVANWFIQKGIDRGAPVTQMQLHKLIYFAHALSLASKGLPIINGPFEAWKYGPVLSDLYTYTKSYGGFGITTPLHVPDGFLTLKIPVIDKSNESLLQTLERTWKVFGKFDAIRLSEISHEEAGPWDKAFSIEERSYIPDSHIAEFYKGRLING